MTCPFDLSKMWKFELQEKIINTREEYSVDGVSWTPQNPCLGRDYCGPNPRTSVCCYPRNLKPYEVLRKSFHNDMGVPLSVLECKS